MTNRTRDGIPFIKMHGTENDYVFIDGFVTSLPSDPDRLARIVSQRRAHIGADGLVFLVPPSDDRSDVEMRIWNADGSAARMCGNAARCIAVWMKREGRIVDQCRIQIADRIVTATDIHGAATGGDATVDMGPAVVLSPPEGDLLELDNAARQSVTLFRVDVGNPHAVVFVSRLSDDLVHTLGPAIENHAALPERSNVEFVVVRGDDELTVRVWERGSGETRSCGSGACAAFAAARTIGLIDAGRPCSVHLSGGVLTVTRGVLTPGDDNVCLSGPVQIAFHGRIHAGP